MGIVFVCRFFERDVVGGLSCDFDFVFSRSRSGGFVDVVRIAQCIDGPVWYTLMIYEA